MKATQWKTVRGSFAVERDQSADSLKAALTEVGEVTSV